MYIPKIYKNKIRYISAVSLTDDESEYLSTGKTEVPEKEYYVPGDKICLDFGRHITGYFGFELGQYDRYLDAPVKLRIKFAETPYEMKRDFAEYKPGLCPSWLQEETITADIKGFVRLPRRYAFRYAEITVIYAPKPVTLSGFEAEACTSADWSKYRPSETTDEFKKIDEISANTLSECMQDFFEDGPKRDRRLWLGDLRLEALANYYTFKNTDIVKRCLYLFAEFDSEDTLLPSCVYTKPYHEPDKAHIVTYALLFTVSLCDYFEHTGDKDVTLDLFDTAKRQIEITKRMLDKNGILTMPEDYGWWYFIDWADNMEPVTATMGIYIYTVSRFAELCLKLGKNEYAEYFSEFAGKLKDASLHHLYNGEVFVNKYDNNQYSVHSQVWMIIAGTVTENDARRILELCVGNKDYFAPSTPYMHHYVVEAFIKAGMEDRAKQYIKDYWGEMVKCGADTFWEVFVKGEPFKTPYNDSLINSACHAWSCTPAYFIRKYNFK